VTFDILRQSSTRTRSWGYASSVNEDMRTNPDLKSFLGWITWVILLLGSAASAEPSLEKNIQLCSGSGTTSSKVQIEACDGLIGLAAVKPQGKAIAHNNRGNAYIREADFDRAIRDFDEALKINPNYAKALNNRGVAYQKKRELDRSIRDFDAAIKLQPNYASAFANRAESYQIKGEYTRAARDFDRVVRLEPDWAVARNGRCWVNAIIGKLKLALTECNEALRLEPKVAATLDSRGLVYLKMARWDAAIADYTAALQLDPTQAGSLYGRGIAKLRKGDASGKTDTAAALAIDANIARQFQRYGVQ